jgi:dihydropteroate synthase
LHPTKFQGLSANQLVSLAGRFRSSAKLSLVMGILNVTPDSFSDGGRFLDPGRAVDHAFRLLEEGADILDVGAESTRPGAKPVSEHEELKRLLPVLERLQKSAFPLPISVDTTKARVALEAIERGASLVNDVSALRWDPSMGRTLAKSNAFVILMHAQAVPGRMQTLACYHNITRTVYHFLHNRIAYAVALGIPKERILIDPGIGFGKRPMDSLTLLRELGQLGPLNSPIVVGVSRKRFLDAFALKPISEEEKDRLSVLAGINALQNGASVLRTHNVGQTAQATRLWKALSCSA